MKTLGQRIPHALEAAAIAYLGSSESLQQLLARGLLMVAQLSEGESSAYVCGLRRTASLLQARRLGMEQVIRALQSYMNPACGGPRRDS